MTAIICTSIVCVTLLLAELIWIAGTYSQKGDRDD